MEPLRTLRTRLHELADGGRRILVAFSGGVDSALLLHQSYSVFGDNCLGILADSPSLARAERQAALDFAQEHHLPVRVVETREIDNPHYRENPPNRCFFCKQELFQQMEAITCRERFDWLAYGENADDPAQDRPGSQAARTFQVLAPLREAGLGKKEVRACARWLGLRVADKVAAPCLASRVKYGVQVTPERLAMVERAEEVLKAHHFRIVRVRHLGENARVQVAPDEVARLLMPAMRTQIERQLKTLGFARVEFDPLGYRGAGLL